MMLSVTVAILFVCFISSSGQDSLCEKAVAQRTPVGCSSNNHFICEVEAGDLITVPCGGATAGAYFNYSLVLDNDVHTAEVFSYHLDFLILNATSSLNGALVYCSTNISTSHSCYGIHVLYAPQTTQGTGVLMGRLNDGYCLSCQVEANPSPSCSWAIKLFRLFHPVPFIDVYPDGVTYPADPVQDCHDVLHPFSLPQPVYPGSGCVMKIQSLTVDFKEYFLQCTASNVLGTIAKTYGPIEIQECGADSSELLLTPSTPSEMVNVTVGAPLTISCSVSNFDEMSSLVWYHNNLSVPLMKYRDTSEYHDDSCVYETHLVFESVSYMDRGNYTCHFYDGFGAVIDKFIYVNVVQPSNVVLCGLKRAYLTLSLSDREATINIGATLNVTCTANNAVEASDIVWLHNDTPVLEYFVVETSFRADTCTRVSTVSIVASNISEGGNYSCHFWSENSAYPVVESFAVTILIPQRDDGAINTSVISGVVAGIVAFICVLIFVLLSVVFTLNRKKLHYFIRWKLKEPGYFYERNGKTVQFDFDVFLSYSSENEHIADVSIRKELEKRHYSVCWHHKDFIAGKLVTENIDECISGCRKTILILSENFLNSEYCKYELVISMSKLKKTSTRCVVPVLMAGSYENLQSLIPPEVLALTYVTIHNEEQGFIDKLCDILGTPIKKQVH